MINKSDTLLTLRHRLQSRLSQKQVNCLRRLLSEPLGFVFRRNLPRLAAISDTDKWGSHRYAPHYQRHFQPLRRKRITLLEIGIGGYENPQEGGGLPADVAALLPPRNDCGIGLLRQEPTR